VRTPALHTLPVQPGRDKRLAFFSFDPLRGEGQEVTHIDDDIPYSYNWRLAPNGSVLAIAKANKLDISVQPDIRLLTLKDGQERTIKLRGWPTVSSLDWRPTARASGSSTSTTTGTNALLNVDLQGRARPWWEQDKMVVGWAIPSPDGRYISPYGKPAATPTCGW
jgi:hypothetical protein